MRKFLGLIIMICLVVGILSGCSKTASNAERQSIRISGAWALYPMMLVWADEYMQLNPIEIEVTGGGAGKGMSDVLNGQVDIGMVSRPIKKEELDKGAFYISVAKDTVIAIVNENNPVYDQILQKGISQENLRRIFMREITRWGDLYNQNLENDTIVVYGRSDSSGAASVWATFLGNYSEADLQNKSDANVSGDQAIAQSVIRDKNSISFTNLNYVFEPVSGGYNHTIRPVPIDLNENGRLDENESFYHKREAFLENVAKGLYPSPPTRDEFLVGRGSFEGAVKDFIEWILTDGQNFLEENGYIRLLENERELEAAFLERGSRE